MKSIFLSIVAFVTIVIPAYAASTVWFTPIPGKEKVSLASGDPILVYAKLENTSKDTITYVLSFDAEGKTIGTKVISVQGYSGQDVSVTWTMPADPVLVSVTVAKATDIHKKAVSSLVGPVGSVQVGGTSAPVSEFDVGTLTGWTGRVLTTLESFRTKELTYFTALQKDAQVVLGRTTIKDVSTLLQPETKTTSPTSTTPVVEKKDMGTTWGYAKLVYATLGKALFANKTTYFVVLIFVVLLGIRFVFRLLLR